MKKILALLLSVMMVFALAACGGGSAPEPASEVPAVEEAPAAEAPAAEAPAGEVTWADYQQYLIDTAGSNAPDLDEFKAQVEAIGSWDELDQTVSPWDQMFTTIGLSTWEEFQQGIVKEAAVMGGPDPSASGEASGEGSQEPAAEGDASQEPSGEPSGEKLDNTFDCEVEIDGQTVTAHYEDTDNGDQATKGFVITVDGRDITGAIDKGVWTADSGDGADQAIIDQVQAAFESGNTVGPQA